VNARLLAGVATRIAPTYDQHLALHGPLDPRGDLTDELDRAGLRGRGGAAFPTGTKLRAVAEAGGRPLVVANAVEGEPVSGKDRALLRVAPHLVLDGAVAACRALGARDAIVAIGDRTGRERAMVEAAIAQRGRKDGRVTLRTAAVESRFVAGEETALVRALGGREAKPSLKPPYPFERGLDGAPTLVANAETLAHVALIARFGAGWFRSAGTSESPGTALVTIGGAVVQPGVHEIELGTTLDQVLEQTGGANEAVQAILVGGYFGRWVTPATARELRLTPEESAGQCGPCVHGLRAIADTMSAPGEPDRRRRLEQLAALVDRRGACRHPDGAAGFLRSALDAFADEFAAHVRRGRCGARDARVLPIVGRRQR